MPENESSAPAPRSLRTSGLTAALPDAVRTVVARLTGAGHRALVVGGSVRDLCLGRVPVDQDIATSASAEQVLALFADGQPTGERFGSIAVGGSATEAAVEVTTFRTEGPYSDGRHPDWVAPARDEHADAVRRDFTVNALYLDLGADQVLDPVGGLPDLRAGVLRAIGDPLLRLREDALRSLRAVRIAVRCGLVLVPSLRAALLATAPGLARLSADRVRGELELLLQREGADQGLVLLAELGLLAVVLPEVAPVAVAPAAGWLRALGALGPSDLTDAWAAVLHAAPPATVAAALARLRLPRAVAQGVQRRLADWELLPRFADLPRAEQARWLLRSDLEPAVHWLQAGCDATGRDRAPLAAMAAARDRLPAATALITGRDVMAAGVAAGPRVGEILRAVTERVLAGELRDRDQALAALRALVAGRPPV